MCETAIIWMHLGRIKLTSQKAQIYLCIARWQHGAQVHDGANGHIGSQHHYGTIFCNGKMARDDASQWHYAQTLRVQYVTSTMTIFVKNSELFYY